MAASGAMLDDNADMRTGHYNPRTSSKNARRLSRGNCNGPYFGSDQDKSFSGSHTAQQTNVNAYENLRFKTAQHPVF